MGQILFVLVLAAAAGAIAYRVSLSLVEDERAETEDGGFLEETSAATTASELPAGYRYAVLAPGYRSWQTRLLGLIGIVIVIVVMAMVLALVIYEIGHVSRSVLDGFIGPSVTPSP